MTDNGSTGTGSGGSTSAVGDFSGNGAWDIAVASGSTTVSIFMQNLTTTTAAATFTYDSLNRQVTATNADGDTTTTAYDADGNVITVKDPLSRVTTYLYDGSNNLTGIIDPTGAKSAPNIICSA